MAQERSSLISRAGEQPTRMLFEYAGNYEHPSYGRIAIDLERGALHWRFRGRAGALQHRHYDVFVVEGPPVSGFRELTFLYDQEGNIDRLAAPFGTSEIVFARVAGGDCFDPRFLASCVGVYRDRRARDGEIRYVVTLEAGFLVLTSSGGPTTSGGPTYRLAPCVDRIFTIAGLESHRIEFWVGADERIEKIVFHQPNGTFGAGRIAEA